MNPQDIDGVIKMSKKKDFKPFVQKAAKKARDSFLTFISTHPPPTNTSDTSTQKSRTTPVLLRLANTRYTSTTRRRI